MSALDADLAGRYPDADKIHGLYEGDAENPRLIFLVVRVDGAPVACGAVREIDAAVGELKRMFVCPSGGRPLARTAHALEAHARRRGYDAPHRNRTRRRSVALYR